MKTASSRRSFLRKSAASVFGISVLPSHLALGKEDSDGNRPPSQRINLGCVGVGNRASIVIPMMCQRKLAVPVAFCDVDFKAPRIDGNLRAYPDIPRFADFREMLMKAEKKPFSFRYHPFRWRAFYLYGNGMLGDWGAHIIDFVHHYLNPGLPSKITAIKLEDHNRVIFPLVTQIAIHFSGCGEGMPACDLTWRDGNDCEPEVDEKYWTVQADGTRKKPGFGVAGTLVYPAGADFVVKRGSHAETSTLYPYAKNKEHIDAVKPPEVLQGGLMSSTLVDCSGKTAPSGPPPRPK